MTAVTSPPVAPAEAPSAPPIAVTPPAARVVQRPSTWVAMARRVFSRRNVAVVFAVVLLVVVFDRGVAPAMAGYQQHHRAGDFLHRRPTITTGDSFALLQSAAIQLDTVVVEGDSRTLLRGGPAHVASTPAPGEPGNVVIVGRSKRFGADFSSIGSLKIGDSLVVQVRGATAPIRYVVEVVATIAERDPLPASAASESVTLITSTGGLRTPDRVVVVAGRDGGSPRDPSAAPTVYAAAPPTAGEGISLVVWGLAGVVLVILARRVRPMLGRFSPALLVAVVPIAGTVVFKFALACDALLPALS